jgi:hypothetical protein
MDANVTAASARRRAVDSTLVKFVSKGQSPDTGAGRYGQSVGQSVSQLVGQSVRQSVSQSVS